MRARPTPPPGLAVHATRSVLVVAGHFPRLGAEQGGYRVGECASLAQLAERMRTAPPSSVAVVSLAGMEGGAAVVQALRYGSPAVPLVAAVPHRGAGGAQVREVLAAGVAEVMDADAAATLGAMVPWLRRAHAAPLKRRVQADLPAWLPETARTVVRAAAETVVDLGGRETLAAIFGVTERTVSDWCDDLRLPLPRRLLGWMRVLLALTLLEEKARTVGNVAVCCGYSDDSSLKRAIANFTGADPRGSTRSQTFPAALARFTAELRDLRERPRRIPSAGA